MLPASQGIGWSGIGGVIGTTFAVGSCSSMRMKMFGIARCSRYFTSFITRLRDIVDLLFEALLPLLINMSESAIDELSPPSSSNSNGSKTSPVIYLNVGGHIFATTKTTLQMVPTSMLARMFSGAIPTTMDDKGRYFIDRDGTYFRYILNYLRDGFVNVPNKIAIEVLHETRFYGLDDLSDYLEEKVPDLSNITLAEEVRKIKYAAKQADMTFRRENENAIQKLTQYLLKHTEASLQKSGTAGQVDIVINNERIRNMVLEDLRNEGLTFSVTIVDTDRDGEKGTEWRFTLQARE